MWYNGFGNIMDINDGSGIHNNNNNKKVFNNSSDLCLDLKVGLNGFEENPTEKYIRLVKQFFPDLKCYSKIKKGYTNSELVSIVTSIQTCNLLLLSSIC